MEGKQIESRTEREDRTNERAVDAEIDLTLDEELVFKGRRTIQRTPPKLGKTLSMEVVGNRDVVWKRKGGDETIKAKEVGVSDGEIARESTEAIRVTMEEKKRRRESGDDYDTTKERGTIIRKLQRQGKALEELVRANPNTKVEIKKGIAELIQLVEKLTAKNAEWDKDDVRTKVKKKRENEVERENLLNPEKRGKEENEGNDKGQITKDEEIRKLRIEVAELKREILGLERSVQKVDGDNWVTEKQLRGAQEYGKYKTLEQQHWKENLFTVAWVAKGNPVKRNKDADLLLIVDGTENKGKMGNLGTTNLFEEDDTQLAEIAEEMHKGEKIEDEKMTRLFEERYPKLLEDNGRY